MAMARDLCEHAMRGLVWSVAGLAWHGLGIDAGCTRQEVIRVLNYMRAREPMTKSELRRGTHLEKEERDQLLECLAAEGLVRMEGKTVVASSYLDSVELLYARKDFAEQRNKWASIKRKDKKVS